MAFQSFELTNEGINLLAQVQAELGSLNFTQIKIGDGDYTGDIKDLTDIISEFHNFPVTSTQVQPDSSVKIQAPFTNETFTQAYTWREIGIYAKLGDTGVEILYSYSKDPTPDTIPSYDGGANIYRRTLDIRNYISDVDSVTLEIVELTNKYDFNTVAEMQVASYIVDGDRVKLWGYYSLGDGGDHERIVSNVDNGNGILLNNGLFAIIPIGGIVNVKWFGAKGDGLTNDAPSIQKALNTGDVITGENSKYFLDCDKIPDNITNVTSRDEYGLYIIEDKIIKDIEVSISKTLVKWYETPFRVFFKENESINVDFENVRIIGNGDVASPTTPASQDGGLHGIRVERFKDNDPSQNIKIKVNVNNCYFEDIGTDGCSFATVKDGASNDHKNQVFNVFNSTFNKTRRGAVLIGNGIYNINDCKFYSTEHNGLVLFNSTCAYRIFIEPDPSSNYKIEIYVDNCKHEHEYTTLPVKGTSFAYIHVPNTGDINILSYNLRNIETNTRFLNVATGGAGSDEQLKVENLKIENIYQTTDIDDLGGSFINFGNFTTETIYIQKYGYININNLNSNIGTLYKGNVNIDTFKIQNSLYRSFISSNTEAIVDKEIWINNESTYTGASLSSATVILEGRYNKLEGQINTGINNISPIRQQVVVRGSNVEQVYIDNVFFEDGEFQVFNINDCDGAIVSIKNVTIKHPVAQFNDIIGGSIVGTPSEVYLENIKYSTVGSYNVNVLTTGLASATNKFTSGIIRINDLTKRPSSNDTCLGYTYFNGTVLSFWNGTVWVDVSTV